MPTNDLSFVNKLRMDNLYPTAPRGRKPRNDFNQFQQVMNSAQVLNEDRPLEQIGRETTRPMAPGMEPTKPMDVVFNDNNISEIGRAMNASRVINNVDLQRNALSPYQAGQLQNRDRQLDIQEQNYAGNRNLGQQRVDETAEMNEWKRKNPGGRIIHQPDGKIIAIGPDNKIAGEFGPSGVMAEERKLGVQQQDAVQRIDRGGEVAGALEDKRQWGRMQSGTQSGLNAIATETARAGNRPTGTTRDVSYQYGPGGEITGARSTSKQVLPEKKSTAQAMMYGPNGEGPYPIPVDQTDAAQEKYGMTFQPKKQLTIGK